MKRYEKVIATALVTVLFVMCCPMPCQGANQRTGKSYEHKPRPHCWQMKEKFYMKNRCEGFVTVSTKNQVILQQTGLDTSHPAAAVIKETCNPALEPGTTSRQLVRYLHQQTNKYICFDRKGRVRAVSGSRVGRRGKLCMFVENRINPSYHIIRSYHNPSWHLGFNRKRSVAVRGSRHTAATPRRGFATNVHSCEAQFHSGRHAPVNLPNQFSGIFDQIHQLKTDVAVPKAVVSNSAARPLADQLPSQTSSKDLSENGNPKISKAHLEALRLQQIWLGKKRAYRIRHFKHKRPRPSRRQKILAKKSENKI